MSSDLCRPYSRTLVDEYDVDAVTGVAKRRPWSFPMDLVSYVHQQEILSVLVPDVEAAEVEAMTAVRGASLVRGPSSACSSAQSFGATPGGCIVS